MYDITASIVLYKTNLNDLDMVIKSFLNTDLNVFLFISDNSPTDELKKFIEKIKEKDSRISYTFNNKNGGYGWGHNVVLKNIVDKSKYHLILNPDIFFESGVLEKIYDYMEKNPDIGQLMPKIVSSDGSIQYLCKLYPTPKVLFLRRF